MSCSCLSHVVCLTSFRESNDSGDGAHHIAVHKEGHRLLNTTCEDNLVRLGAWIAKTHGYTMITEMLRGDLDTVAIDVLGRYYGSHTPKFTKLVDAIAGTPADHKVRLSVVREALRAIEREGTNGIQVHAAELKLGFQTKFAQAMVA